MFRVLAPSDRPVIVVESMFMSEDLRNAMTKVIVEKLRCKSLMFMPSHVCATFPFNTQNALVVDIGHSECVAVPVSSINSQTPLIFWVSGYRMCDDAQWVRIGSIDLRTTIRTKSSRIVRKIRTNGRAEWRKKNAYRSWLGGYWCNDFLLKTLIIYHF